MRGLSAARTGYFLRSHDAVIRVYDDAGNVIETHEHAGKFKGGRFFSQLVALLAKTHFP